MDKLFSNLENVMENSFIYGLLAVFLAVYGPRLHPKLPTPVKELFNNNVFKFVVIMLITYLSTNNLQAALLISITFCLVLSYAVSQEVEEKFTEQYKENYSDFDSIREFYDDKEDFNANPNEVADDSGPEGVTINNREEFNKLEEQAKKLKEGENFENFETEDFNDTVPDVCKGDNKNSKECVNHCYQQAGLGKDYCKETNPQKLEVKENCQKAVDARKAALAAAATKRESNSKKSTKTSEEEGKSSESFFGNLGLNKLDSLAQNIVQQVNKYKNM